jgi:hypothetical protein
VGGAGGGAIDGVGPVPATTGLAATTVVDPISPLGGGPAT